MRVFVTGATGFIGSAVVRELLDAGHEVTGLARSESAAASLADAGASVHRGSLQDPDSLRAGAAAADGVIHTAYIHDFTPAGDPAAAAATDGHAIAAMGEALAGSDRPLVVASAPSPPPAGRAAGHDAVPRRRAGPQEDPGQRREPWPDRHPDLGQDGPAARGARPADAAVAARVPLGRFGTAEEVAELVAFLAAAYITGENITIGGGSGLPA